MCNERGPLGLSRLSYNLLSTPVSSLSYYYWTRLHIHASHLRLGFFFFSQVKEKGNNSRRLPTYLFISPHITIILFRKIYDLLRGNITKNCADRFVLMARPERSHGSQQQQQSIRKRGKKRKEKSHIINSERDNDIQR